MKIGEFSNITLRNEISYWLTKRPSLKNFFLSESMGGLLKTVDAATYVIKEPKLIADFILGLVAYKFWTEEKNDEDRQYLEDQIDILVMPLMNVLKKHFEGDFRDYLIDQEVTGDEIIVTDRVNVPITKKALQLHIGKTKVFPLTTVDIEKVLLDFIDHKEQIYSKPVNSLVVDAIINSDNEKCKHNLPIINIKKYDSKKIYSQFFKGVIAVCTIDCFNDWFVNGFKAEQITFVLKGRKDPRTGIPTMAKSQLISFIVAITCDASLETKLSYYTTVFGKETDVKGSKMGGLNSNLLEKLKLCEL